MSNDCPSPVPSRLFRHFAGPLMVAFAVVALWSLDGQEAPPPAVPGLPVGAISAFAGPVDRIPAAQGWLPCDGRTVSASEFPELFAVIGTAWGAGRDTGSFLLPDLRGRFLRGVNGPATDGLRDPEADARTAPAEGGNQGNAVGSLQEDSLAHHNHPLEGVALAASSDFSGNAMNVKFYGTRIPDETAQSIVNVTAVLPAGGLETRPRNAYVHWMIRAR